MTPTGAGPAKLGSKSAPLHVPSLYFAAIVMLVRPSGPAAMAR